MRIPIYVCNETDIALKTNKSTQAVALYEVLNDVNSSQNNYFGVKIVKNTSPAQSLMYQNLFKRHEKCMFITTAGRLTHINTVRLPWYKISRLFFIVSCIYLLTMGGIYTNHTRTLTQTLTDSEKTLATISNIQGLYTQPLFTQPLGRFISFFLNSEIDIQKLHLTESQFSLSGQFSLLSVQTVATALNQLKKEIRFSKNGRIGNNSKKTASWHINTNYEHQ